MTTVRVNMTNGAPSQYTNFTYNSMCELEDGSVLMAGDSGLFSLGGCGTDNETDIDAYFDTGISDLGTLQKKSPRFVYAGIESDGAVTVSVIADQTKNYGPYIFQHGDDAATSSNRRAKLGMGIKFTYGQFRISNVDGEWFSIDQAKLMYIISGRTLF